MRGARQHNLKKVDLRVPLGTFTAVTGVSGSGKSTLTDVLYRRWPGVERLPRARRRARPAGRRPAPSTRSSRSTRAHRAHASLQPGHVHRPVRSDPRAVRQRSRGPRPWVHAGALQLQREGRPLRALQGDGILKIEMQFLPDVYVTCEVCKGKRYNREALEIHYKGRSIADVLEMTIEEALGVFSAVPKVAAKLGR